MSAAAIDDAQFAELMAAVGPFRRRPRLAVATSGGADSLAVCLLAASWARQRHGSIVALTINHGLRSDAASEARTLGRWLEQRSIAHEIIRWHGAKPTSAIQESARAARYGLLSRWCRDNEILHLLLGHHCDDQAETLMIRVSRGSGPDGLAAMPLQVERDGVRYLRPCLGIPHARLVATLEVRGQTWIDDPSNRDMRFTRARVRRRLARAQLTNTQVATSARHIGLARALREEETSKFLARTTVLDPRGYCRLGRQAIRHGEIDTVRRAIARILLCLGGGGYAPRRARINRLVDEIRGDEPLAARTLGGCRIVACDATLVVCREVGRIGAAVRLVAGETTRWDDRFEIRMSGPTKATGLTVAAYAGNAWRERDAARNALARRRIAAVAIPSIPAIYQRSTLIAVPHLGLYDQQIILGARALQVRFAPRHPLAPARFSVA